MAPSDDAIRAAVKAAVDRGRAQIEKNTLIPPASPGSLSGVGQPWSNPNSDPLNDMRVVAIKTGLSNPNYTPQEINRHPQLKTCSKCWTERTEVKDPWGFTKICQRCGYVDGVPSGKPAPPPETITWPEVQKMIVGILRQVEGQKVQVHPDEFNTDGVTVLQHTDPVTGVVTIWFEKADNR